MLCWLQLEVVIAAVLPMTFFPFGPSFIGIVELVNNFSFSTLSTATKVLIGDINLEFKPVLTYLVGVVFSK